jgi:hypothetical protein
MRMRRSSPSAVKTKARAEFLHVDTGYVSGGVFRELARPLGMAKKRQ